VVVESGRLGVEGSLILEPLNTFIKKHRPTLSGSVAKLFFAFKLFPCNDFKLWP
jgi:hypothetical protein